MKAFWNNRFTEHTAVYGEEPNQFFKDFLDAQPMAGSMLLPAEGQGRNAIYAAKKGWQVDAFDFSEAAQKTTLDRAKREGVSVHYEVTDIGTFRAHRQYDCIALIFVHQPESLRKSFHQELVQALKPGGWLVAEVYSKSQIHNNTGGPQDLAMLYDVATFRSDFEGFNFLTLEELHTDISEGIFHSGMSDVVRCVARKPM